MPGLKHLNGVSKDQTALINNKPNAIIFPAVVI